MNYFFTADSHLKHYLPELKRPFIGHEMDELIVNNWNSKIKKGDEVFFLGDFALHMPLSIMKLYFERLVGNKHLILGNHDSSNKVKKLKWGSIHQVFEFKMPEEYRKKLNIPSIWLSHYPHRSWPKSSRGSLHFHGHSHGHMSPYPNSLDVGVDCHGFMPLSLDEAISLTPKMERKV